MLPTLQITLLSDFKLVYGGAPVTSINSARLQSLLAYLLLHRDTPQSRQHLAFLFWPDSSEAQARTNLRREWHTLRHALPDADRFVCADAKTLQWRPDALFTLDVADFERAVAAAERADTAGDTSEVLARLKEATTLYHGDLLPDCYDEWLLPKRERLHQGFVKALERLSQLLEHQRDYDAAIRYAELLLRYDSLDEATYRRLMRLYALKGDRAQALRVYHACVSVLQRGLAVEPSPATHELYERLLKTTATPPPPSASQPLTSTTLLPLVGRRKEWAQLQIAWHSAAYGRAQFVWLAGEAGIGKTRLAEELLTWANRQGMATARTRCYAAEGRLAYAPVTDWLRQDALWTALAHLDPIWLSEVAHVLPELLVERPQLPRLAPLTERWQRQRLFEALARAVLAAKQPLLLVLDDLQWCDLDTLQWLRYLLRSDPTARLLIVGTVRTEETDPEHALQSLLSDLRSSEQLAEITLGPLDAAETATLAAQVAGQDLDADLATYLYRETEGNPLFVVETVRGRGEIGVESGAAKAINNDPPEVTLHIRSTLLPKVYAVIASRLAQLSAIAQDVARLAATVGRAFTSDVLVHASEHDESVVVRGLDELWRRHIVREQGMDVYDFSHDKIREVAYAEVSPAHRRLLHRRVAQTLERLYASDLDTVSGQLATHYERAGMPAQATPYYQRAAEVAQRVYANQEAIVYLRKGLELLHHLPDTPKRIEQELKLQIGLDVSLRTVKGWSAPEVEKIYARARDLCQQAGDTPQLFPVQWGLCTFYIVRSELGTARELAERSLHLAQSQPNRTFHTMAHCILGIVLFHLAELPSARAHLEQSSAQYDPQQHRSHIFLYGPDLGVFCLSYAAHTLWYLGYPDQALKRSQEALALARELSHPFSVAIALDYAAMLQQFRREQEAAQAQAETAIALSAEQGFAYYLGWGTIIQGWALAERGAIDQGIAQMHQGLDALQSAGAQLRRPYYLALLAERYAKTGQPETGLRVLDEAFVAMDKTGEGFYEAELHRLKGELLMAQGANEIEVEASFRQALEIARRQHAKSLELRAAMSLSRLWNYQERTTEAHALLAEVYNWFTEGFGTPDLQEARALLQVLSKQHA